MSGAARARVSNRPHAVYCSRPETEQPNSGLPKFGYHVQHRMIPSDGVAIKAIFSLKPAELEKGRGRVLREGGLTVLTKATARFTHDGLPMPRRTLAHRLKAMQDIGILQRFDTEASPHSPRGTSWRIPLYSEVLDRWANDPAIGTVGKRCFYVQGKGRRFLTPEELIAWQIDHAAAVADPQAQAAPIDAGESAAAPAPGTAAEARHAEPEPVDLAPLVEALLDVCGAAELDDAEFVWRRIIHITGERRPVPPVEDVVPMVYSIAKERRKTGGGRAPILPGLIEKRIGGRVEAWQRDRVQNKAAQEKAQRWARDNRVNQIAEWIRDLERSDLEADIRKLTEEMLAASDPPEIEAARELLAAIQARRA